jgi:phosphate transport system substrate-binding protein
MSTNRIGMTAVLLASLLLAGAPRWIATQDQPPPFIEAERYPVVDGSTSTQPLGVLLACRISRTAFQWVLNIDKIRRLYPLTDAYDATVKLNLAFNDRYVDRGDIKPHKVLARRVNHSGTHGSYKNLIEGKAKLALVAREPSEDELKMAAERGARIQHKPIALDALVFIVNKDNPVSNLTVEQIQKIYTGEITDWKEVGGAAGPIHPYQRNRNSGSQEKMEKLVMEGRRMIEPRNIEASFTMVGPFNLLTNDRQGLGYSVRYFDTFMENLSQVKTIAINGILPDPVPIANRSYPFVSEVVVAWIGDLPADSPERIVRDWLLTDDGAAVIEESGYIPIKPLGEPEKKDGAATPAP